MSGVFSGGASEQAPSSSVSAAPDHDDAIRLFSFLCFACAAHPRRPMPRRRGAPRRQLPIPSGGFSITRSFGERPEASSTTVPKSRAIDTGLSSTRLSASTVAMESPLASKISALDGTLSTLGGGGDLQMDAGVVARHHLTGAIVDDELHQGRAGARVDRLGRSLDRPAIGLVGMFGHADRRLGAWRHARHIVLRHVDIDAQLAGIGDHEQLRAAGGPHIDQCADVGFARGDDAIERRDQVLEAFLGDQAVDVRLRRLDLGDIGVQGESALVDVLLGDGIGAGERLPALCADLRELGIGLERRSGRRAPASSCWSRSGVSISASTSPAFTLLPISCFQLFR